MERMRPEDIERAEVARRQVEAAESRLRVLERTQFSKLEVAKTTERQMGEAIEALRDMPELKPEVWRGLSPEQRFEALRGVEQRMAAIQGRPPVEMTVEPCTLAGASGQYDHSTGRMSIAPEELQSENPYRVLDTVINEGRHAYQHYAVEHPGFHPISKEAQLWEWNMEPDNYLMPNEVGGRAYALQPIEIDAISYSSGIVMGLI